ncbi:hypothetical protein [Streptomyces shenzhenensis]|uniref:hypothetical protein n=1 Tax=Streptomyces shenzhenensis TaxID=943815 RepID=UPI0015F0430B|nr:hypothetical protein [Streptomyces shenzhenensis]
MPFTVTGAFDDGATYSVQVTGRADRPVIGSHRATALVELHQRSPVSLFPTGPVRTVAGDDEATVLAVLREHTRVVDEGQGAPRQTRLPES